MTLILAFFRTEPASGAPRLSFFFFFSVTIQKVDSQKQNIQIQTGREVSTALCGFSVNGRPLTARMHKQRAGKIDGLSFQKETKVNQTMTPFQISNFQISAGHFQNCTLLNIHEAGFTSASAAES